VVFDEDCQVSELCLTKLAIHNLKMKTDVVLKDCQISEYPMYLRKKIFKQADKIVIQPVTPFPDCINNEMIDSCVKAHFESFNFPLSFGHQLIIPIACKGRFKFASVFKITKVEPEILEQFVFGDKTEVYLKLQILNERIPCGIQQNLTNSLFFPSSHLFTSFPESKLLENFMKCERFGQNPLSTALIHGPFGAGKRTLVRRLADIYGVPFYSIDLYKEKEEAFTKIIELLEEKFEIYGCILIEGIELLNKDIKLRSIWTKISSNYPERNLKLISCYSYLNKKPISDYIMGSFDVVEKLQMPGTFAIKKLVKEMYEIIPVENEAVSEDDFIGYTISDFVGLIEKYREAGKDFNEIFEEYKKIMKLRISLQSNTLEIPKVKWDQVAGLREVKIILKDLIGKLQKKPRPTGVLLHGPPGTGKTLIAKALATQSRFALLPVKGPELLSPYIGESESALREIFSQASSMSPCIIFFDELDALVPCRGEFGDSVGVADRMVATFMTEMDKINGLSITEECDNCIFVIGATNRPDLIDPALMRKGRFDISILLDYPKTIEERGEILEASCKKINCSDEIDFMAPFNHPLIKDKNLSPAQIASIAKNASKIALERKLRHLKLNPNDNLLIDPITTEDLINSIKELNL
jgi:SpoVK/Ycf46/Vps4 family AAA+-type ATPase